MNLSAQIAAKDLKKFAKVRLTVLLVLPVANMEQSARLAAQVRLKPGRFLFRQPGKFTRLA